MTRRLLTLTVALLALLLAGSLTTATYAARVPPTPRALPHAVEDLAGYVPANSCAPTPRKGIVRFAATLRETWPGTTTGTHRACGSDPLPTSEHYDGRAIDWMVGTGRKGRRQASALLDWLFRKDDGTKYAMARRLGVMYVIWRNRIWGSYNVDEGWRPYSSCRSHPEKAWDTSCHRDHVHLSFSWAGATGRTSWFAGRVARPDYGPCRRAGMNWARRYPGANPTPCRDRARPHAPRRAPAYVRDLVTWSGMRLHRGMAGPAVAAVNRALQVPGSTYGVRTRKAVVKLQRRHDLRTSGALTVPTWRVLLGKVGVRD